MEPVDLTASIATLTDLCGKIINYLRDVNDAPTEFKDLELEIRSTQGILKTLQIEVQDAQAAPDKWSETIQSLDEKPDGPLHLISMDLTTLHDGLSKAMSGGKLEIPFWPLEKDKLENLVNRIGRQKACVLLALENDQSNAMHDDAKAGVLNQHHDDREREDGVVAEEIAEALINDGPDIQFKNLLGSTTLTEAAERGDEGVVKSLLKNGATLEVENSRGWTPLTFAARCGHETIVRILLQALIKLHSLHPPGCTTSLRKDARFKMDEIMGKDHEGRTPLSHAAQHGHLAVVKLLLDHGADAESQCNIGRTPLSYAAENESPGAESAISVMGLLVEYGARLDTKNKGRFTALSFAIRSPSLGPDRPTGSAMLKFLLEKYFETDPKPPNDVPLAMAVIGRMHLVLRNLAKRQVGQISSILWFLQDIPGTVEGMDWAICLGLCMVFGVDVISETMATLELGGCQFEVGVGHNWPIRCTRSSKSATSAPEPLPDDLAARMEQLEANLDRVLATIGSS